MEKLRYRKKKFTLLWGKTRYTISTRAAAIPYHLCVNKLLKKYTREFIKKFRPPKRSYKYGLKLVISKVIRMYWEVMVEHALAGNIYDDRRLRINVAEVEDHGNSTYSNIHSDFKMFRVRVTEKRTGNVFYASLNRKNRAKLRKKLDSGDYTLYESL